MASSFGNTVVAIILVSVCHSANAGAIWATNGHEYEVVFSHRIAWDTARSAAQGLGSGWDLATIGSAEENVFVASLLDAGLPERSHFWLGAADAVTENTWEWIDGTGFSYTNWWPFEPNDFTNEDFLAFDLRGGSWAWNDVQATEDKLTGYVAERSRSTSVPEPSSIALVGAVAIAGAWTRRRRN